MDIGELVSALSRRASVNPGDVRPGMRIAIKSQDGYDVMRVAAIGRYGDPIPGNSWGGNIASRRPLAVVAKVSPSEFSTTVTYEGQVKLNTLSNVSGMGGPLNGFTNAHYHVLSGREILVPVSRGEMRLIRQNSPPLPHERETETRLSPGYAT